MSCSTCGAKDETHVYKNECIRYMQMQFKHAMQLTADLTDSLERQREVAYRDTERIERMQADSHVIPYWCWWSPEGRPWRAKNGTFWPTLREAVDAGFDSAAKKCTIEVESQIPK